MARCLEFLGCLAQEIGQTTRKLSYIFVEGVSVSPAKEP